MSACTDRPYRGKAIVATLRPSASQRVVTRSTSVRLPAPSRPSTVISVPTSRDASGPRQRRVTVDWGCTSVTMGRMKPRILVVDDDAALAEMLTIVLRGEGFEPFVVGDGTQALSAVRDIRPDLVLLDLMLPA